MLRPARRPLRQLFTALAGVLGLSCTAHAYVVTAFDGSIYTTDTVALDAALGLPASFVVEDFEDATLIPGLSANLSSDGRVLPNHAWDGLTTTISGNAAFSISLAGIRFFGIGISDNDGGGQTLTVNGSTLINLDTIAGYRGDSSSHATYVIVRAEGSDADITTINIDGSMTPMFDHLVLSTEGGLGPTSSVPEPGSTLLALAGIGTIARLRRR